jgi:hypothetical protein
MSADPNSPCKLLSVINEIEAASVASALAGYDIESTTVGGFTSGFKAEAPGSVQILVRRADLDRATRALAEIREDQGTIDWSTVDVGDPEA